MAAKNDITGDSLISKITSENYANNYDVIFTEKFDVLTIAGKEYTKCSKRCWLSDESGNPSCIKPGCETYTK